MERWLNPRLCLPETAILISDRSISSVGKRRLQYFRSRQQKEYWPSPGVFNFPELAQRICFQASQLLQDPSIYPELLTPAELMEAAFVLCNKKSLTPREIWRRYQKVENLWKCGLSEDRLYDIAKEIEKDNKEAELKYLSSGVLVIYSMIVAGQGKKINQQTDKAEDENTPDTPFRIANPWQWIELACEQIQNLGEELDWKAILDRPPWIEESSIIIDTHKDLFPLEEKLLEAIRPLIKIESQTAAQEELPTPGLKAKIISRAEASVFWGHPKDKPGPIEALMALEGDYQLDLAEGKSNGPFPLLRALYLWIDYHEKRKPKLHPFVAGRKHQKLLEGFGLAPMQKPESMGFWNLLLEQFPDQEKRWGPLRNHLDLSYRDNFLLLVEEGFFKRSEDAVLENQRLHPAGVAILTLEDFPLLASSENFFWCDEDTLNQQCDPRSLLTLKKRIFPESLEKYFRDELSLPDPQKEAGRLRNFIEQHKKHCFHLIPPDSQTPQKAPPAQAQSKIYGAKKSFSPTAIEKFYKCPMLFYLERELDIGQNPEIEAPELNPLELGNWVHYALEDFFKTPDWTDPSQAIQKALAETLDRALEKNHSPSFRLFFERKIPWLATRLVAHINGFESSLRKAVRIEKSLLEVDVFSSISSFKLGGRMDRVDHCAEGILLFDFKTGNFSTKAKTLVKNGKFQWFVYEMMAKETLGKEVLAGGYLNPLNPSKSALFCFEGSPTPLVEAFAQSPHNFEMITSSQQKELHMQVSEIVKTVGEGIRSESRPAKPMKDSECDSCRVGAYCGRSYFRSKQEVTT